MLNNEAMMEIVRIGRESESLPYRPHRYMSFALDCFALIKQDFPEQANDWLKTAEKCRDGIASKIEVEDAANQACEYAALLGEVSEDDVSTKNGAIAYLFKFALYHELVVAT